MIAEVAPRIRGKRGPVRGPCETCGCLYRSYGNRHFCSFQCYHKSDAFRKMLADNRAMVSSRARAHAGLDEAEQPHFDCIECGKEKLCKPHAASSKKYCSQLCYRRYMAKRFDRWVANPESVALPQNYDEFLIGDTLRCPVDGCEWEGEFLGAHVNFAHGITAREFKKLAGFNLGTGLVTPRLSKFFSQNVSQLTGAGVPNAFNQVSRAPQSLEAREHGRKAQALIRTSEFNERMLKLKQSKEYRARQSIACRARDARRRPRTVVCSKCAQSWNTKTTRHVAVCPKCVRVAMLERNRVEPWKLLTCFICAREFWATRNIVRLARKAGIRPVCSEACKQGRYRAWKRERVG